MDQQSKAYSRVKNELIAELMGDLHGKQILDYGCGAGLHTVHAAQSGAARVVGVDAEENVLSTARYFAQREGVDRLLNSERFPFFSAHIDFDIILMKDVLEHVVDDQALLKAAAQVIAPGGAIIICTQNAFSMNYLVEGTIQRAILGNKNWMGWDETHVRFYNPFTLHRKLTRVGFTPVAWRSVYLVPYKLPGLPGSGKQFTRIDSLSWIDRVLGRVFPFNRLGWNIIVKAVASPLVPQYIGQDIREKKAVSPVTAIAPPAVI